MKHLKVLNAYFFKYKKYLLSGLLFVTLSSLFGTYQGVIVRKGTNRVIELINQNTTAPAGKFIEYGITIIVLALISGLFMFLMRQTIIVMSRHIEYDQKNEIYNHYQQLDTEFYKKNSTGDLMNRISEDVGKVRMYTGPAIMYLTNTVVTTITILIFMFSVNVSLTLMVFLPLPILSFIIYKVSDLINKRSTKVQEELSTLTSQAQETFSAIRLIKAYARETFFGEEMEDGSRYSASEFATLLFTTSEKANTYVSVPSNVPSYPRIKYSTTASPGRTALIEGIKEAQKSFITYLPNIKSSSEIFGSREYLKNNYLGRAIGAWTRCTGRITIPW